VSEIPPDVSRVVLLSQGEITADGPKQQVLTSERLTALYGTPISVHEIEGHYVALPRSRA
jgi:iron complex transport system ATP-binding protein